VGIFEIIWSFPFFVSGFSSFLRPSGRRGKVTRKKRRNCGMARANTIRILRLLLLEQHGVKDSAAELARRFGVTRRTIMRDRAAMRKAKAGFELGQGARSNKGTSKKPGR
jgi:hypothetical protein